LALLALNAAGISSPERTMKLIELMERLGLWPLGMTLEDAGAVDCAQADQRLEASRAIVVPPGMRPLIHAACWPTEYDRRTRH
jgi:hypothetical protein